MKRRQIFVLLAVSGLAGALLLALARSGRIRERPCADPATCGADAASPAAKAEPAPPIALSRGGAAAAPPATRAAADGPALRDEADRLIKEGKVLQGLDVFRKAVEADPSAKNHGDLGHLLYRLTAFDEAAIHLRAAAELDPGNADRWIALANLYYRKIDPGEAWKAERRAREAEPGLELGRDRDGMRVRKGETAPRVP